MLQWEVETSNLALTIPIVLVSRRNSLCHSSRGRSRLCSPRSCVNREGRHPAPGNGLLTPARSSQQLFLLDGCANITCSLLWAQIKFLTHCPLLWDPRSGPTSLMVQPASLNLDLGFVTLCSQSHRYTGSICRAAHTPEIGCPGDTLPFLERKELFVLSLSSVQPGGGNHPRLGNALNKSSS